MGLLVNEQPPIGCKARHNIDVAFGAVEKIISP